MVSIPLKVESGSEEEKNIKSLFDLYRHCYNSVMSDLIKGGKTMMPTVMKEAIAGTFPPRFPKDSRPAIFYAAHIDASNDFDSRSDDPKGFMKKSSSAQKVSFLYDPLHWSSIRRTLSWLGIDKAVYENAYDRLEYITIRKIESKNRTQYVFERHLVDDNI